MSAARRRSVRWRAGWGRDMSHGRRQGTHCVGSCAWRSGWTRDAAGTDRRRCRGGFRPGTRSRSRRSTTAPCPCCWRTCQSGGTRPVGTPRPCLPPRPSPPQASRCSHCCTWPQEAAQSRLCRGPKVGDPGRSARVAVLSPTGRAYTAQEAPPWRSIMTGEALVILPLVVVIQHLRTGRPPQRQWDATKTKAEREGVVCAHLSRPSAVVIVVPTRSRSGMSPQ